MGSYDGAEVCELVGLFILESLKQVFGNNIGLYRDDGLAAIHTKSGRLGDKARKDLTRIFNEFGLKITAQANQSRTNFLDVTLDLTDGTYKPYRKSNDDPLYINHSSNHPPSIIHQLPQSINRRINSLSCNKEVFDTSATVYNVVLRNSNFLYNLTYQPATANTTNTKKNRQRNVIWYNPPYSKNVKTNIARDFLQLIDKHFPPSNKLNKLFNRHTVRVSYSCTENMKSFINRHNKTVLRNSNDDQQPTLNSSQRKCNCKHPDNCPIGGNCLQRSVVYKATVTTTHNETNTYIGVTAKDFKTRYRNHTKSFKNKQYRNETELSKHIWQLKDKQQKFSIKWTIIKITPARKHAYETCRLCLEEKLLIMKHRKKTFKQTL